MSRLNIDAEKRELYNRGGEEAVKQQEQRYSIDTYNTTYNQDIDINNDVFP